MEAERKKKDEAGGQTSTHGSSVSPLRLEEFILLMFIISKKTSITTPLKTNKSITNKQRHILGLT